MRTCYGRDMASWLTALRAVPWAEVIDAAPTLVDATRRLMKRAARRGKASPSSGGAAVETDAQRLDRIEAELAEATRLLESLAEQNERLVVAIDRLRSTQARLRRGLMAAGVALVILAAASAWALLR